MSLEKAEAFVGIGIPQSETVIFTSRQHQASILIRLTMSDSAPVALELTLAFEFPRFKLGFSFKLKNLDLRSLRTEHKNVCALGMVANFSDTVNSVAIHVSEVLHGISGSYKFLSFDRGHIDFPLNS